MAQATRIEWTEATWNPVTGCHQIADRPTDAQGHQGQRATAVRQPTAAINVWLTGIGLATSRVS